MRLKLHLVLIIKPGLVAGTINWLVFNTVQNFSHTALGVGKLLLKPEKNGALISS